MPSDTDRKNMRTRMNNQIRELPQVFRKQAANRCAATLNSSLPWREARAVLAYLAFGPELSADLVVEAALAEGKEVYAPVVDGKNMEFRNISSLEDSFSIGPFGIREPQRNARRWSGIATPGPALILVPGLVFDRSGGRMGRGGGYYDRFISTTRLESDVSGEKSPFFVGYAYSIQVTGNLPLEDHDEKIDALITEEASLFF